MDKAKSTKIKIEPQPLLDALKIRMESIEAELRNLSEEHARWAKLHREVATAQMAIEDTSSARLHFEFDPSELAGLNFTP
jgi:hypothetical protein